nr:IS3 family transposase [uncultured Aminipila sp.]
MMLYTANRFYFVSFKAATDNPIIKSINGWIKAEIRCNYSKYEKEDFSKSLEKYVEFFNTLRPAYALDYLNPVQYKIKQSFLKSGY